VPKAGLASLFYSLKVHFFFPPPWPPHPCPPVSFNPSLHVSAASPSHVPGFPLFSGFRTSNGAKKLESANSFCFGPFLQHPLFTPCMPYIFVSPRPGLSVPVDTNTVRVLSPSFPHPPLMVGSRVSKDSFFPVFFSSFSR